jgi:hypothetical protein
MNKEVTRFLDELTHPFRQQIDQLRAIILGVSSDIEENIKWNGPNYTVGGQDRITIRVNPAKTMDLILHKGAKTQAEPEKKLLREDYGLLTWKSNDRAIARFADAASFEKAKPHLAEIVKNWLEATL